MHACVCLVLLQGTAQLSLADCEGSAEMVYRWLPVQMLTETPRHEQKNPNQRRLHDGQDDESRARAQVAYSHGCLCTLCACVCA